jgi:hypothetical protein
MTITLNIQNEQLFDKLLWFLNRFTNEGLEIITHRKTTPQETKKTPLSEFSGMWEGREISQESIREEAWK